MGGPCGAKHLAVTKPKALPKEILVGPRPPAPDHQRLLERAQAGGAFEDLNRVFLDFLGAFESKLLDIYKVRDRPRHG
eukprot:2180542-Pyramimonas_sp.AAC.1